MRCETMLKLTIAPLLVAVLSDAFQMNKNSFVRFDKFALGDRITSFSDSIRKLGGYERLLARKASGLESVALSHATVFILQNSYSKDDLVRAVGMCMERHPLLKSYINTKTANNPDAWIYCQGSDSELASKIVRSYEIDDQRFEDEWRRLFNTALNRAVFPTEGPLWKLDNIVSSSGLRSAWLFTLNHGIDDQQSINILVSDILKVLHKGTPLGPPLPFPPSVEEAVGPGLPGVSTALWSLFQLYNSARQSPMVPLSVQRQIQADAEYANRFANPNNRRTFSEFIEVPATELSELRRLCKNQGVSVTNALAAAVLITTSAAIQDALVDRANDPSTTRASSETSAGFQALDLRFLLSVSLRPFGVNQASRSQSPSGKRGGDFAGGTVACASGAVDFVVPVAAEAAYGTSATQEKMKPLFWQIAEYCRDRTSEIIDDWNFVPESVRLFGFGMQFADILKVVEMEAASASSLGRGYSCGLSNVGVAAFPAAVSTTPDGKRPLKSHGVVSEVYFGTSQARNGVLCLLSCMTVNDRLFGCFQFTDPLVSPSQATCFKQEFLGLIKRMTTT